MRYCIACKHHVEGLAFTKEWQTKCPRCGVLWKLGASAPIPRPFVVYSAAQLPSKRTKLRRWRVGERDGWVCHLCRRPVDPKATGPMEPSLDHVIPKAHGGSSDFENLRLAHRVCNMLRGTRPVEEAAA